MSIGKETKYDRLLDLFDEVGKSFKWKEVCEVTGIENYNTLKAGFSYIRKSPYVDDAKRIDVRILDGICTRMA